MGGRTRIAFVVIFLIVLCSFLACHTATNRTIQQQKHSNIDESATKEANRPKPWTAQSSRDTEAKRSETRDRIVFHASLEQISSFQPLLAESDWRAAVNIQGGLRSMRSGDFVLARLDFQNTISSFPGSNLEAPAFLGIGLCYFREGDLVQAAKQFADFLVIYSEPENLIDFQQAAQLNLAITEIQIMQLEPKERERQTAAEGASEALKMFLQKWPNHRQAPAARASLIALQQYLSR